MENQFQQLKKMKCEIILDPILSLVQTKMACACGYNHTITLSNDGTVYSFGRNFNGELGLGHYNTVSLPTPIPNLSKINVISCNQIFYGTCFQPLNFSSKTIQKQK